MRVIKGKIPNHMAFHLLPKWLKRIGEAMARRILIVDDDPDFVEVLARLFMKWGFEVEIAFNGADALEILERVPLDGMTLGIRMPQIMGFEVLRRLRQKNQQMPVIIISGWLAYMKEGDTDYEFLKNNAQGLFLKPVCSDELKPLVDRYFGLPS